MNMFEKRVEAARRVFEDHQWNPTTRFCTCGEFFEASLAGHELRDAHRMGEAISAADAVVTEEQIAETILKALVFTNENSKPWADGLARDIVTLFRGGAK